MPNWRDRHGQADALLKLSQEAPRAQGAIWEAYLAWSQSPAGQIMLADMAQVLLKPCATPEEEGERRFVLKVLKVLREAEAQVMAHHGGGYGEP